MNEKEFNKYLRKLKTDKKAFNKLYNYYFPQIVLHIYFLYKDYGLGEDVAQEFFIKLLKKAEYEYINYPKKWVETVSENIAKSKISKKIRDREHEQDFMDNQNQIAATKNDPMKVVIFGEYREEIERLDEKTRQIITMKIYEDYDFYEIAEIMGINYDAVRQRFARGIKEIKEKDDGS